MIDLIPRRSGVNDESDGGERKEEGDGGFGGGEVRLKRELGENIRARIDEKVEGRDECVFDGRDGP